MDSKQPLAFVLTLTTASFTTALASKLSGIETGAQVNIPLDADLTAYADAANAQARRVLIGIYETLGAPSNAVGNDNDIAFRKSPFGFYFKSGGAWVNTLIEAPTLNATLTLLGIPTYDDLTAANTALAVGKIYYDTALATLNVTTA